jgi:acyl-CoA synthetase
MISDLKINEQAKKRYYDEGFWTSDTIADVWNKQASQNAGKTFVTDDAGASLTYGQIDDMSNAVAAWLASSGVNPGDVVTFQLPTWAEFCPIFIGIAKAGAVMHPVARNYSQDDLIYIMNKVQTRAFICPTYHHTTDHEKLALKCVDRVDSLEASRVLLVQKNAQAPKTDMVTFEQLVKNGASNFTAPKVGADDVAVILSTSGTTGKPKQALLTHNNVLFSERTFIGGLSLTSLDVMFMPSPLNHATGFFHGIISPMLLAASTVLQQDFSADAAIQLINKHHCTWSMGATPFIYDMIASMDRNGTSVPTLKLFLSGGAPLPGSLVSCAKGHGITLCECYGSTESCPHAYVPPQKCDEWNGDWSGVTLDGIEIRIVDESRNPVAPGEQGEEASRGPNVFVGYLNDPEQTDAVLDDDGWFYSGDLAYMDKEGRLRINGRKKEIIVRGGENISTREVDEACSAWPAIIDQATIGAPDDRMGERICLFAVAAPTCAEAPKLENLLAFLKVRGVSKRLWPERLEMIDEIPRTATGKVQRFKLSEELKKRMA